MELLSKQTLTSLGFVAMLKEKKDPHPVSQQLLRSRPLGRAKVPAGSGGLRGRCLWNLTWHLFRFRAWVSLPHSPGPFGVLF